MSTSMTFLDPNDSSIQTATFQILNIDSLFRLNERLPLCGLNLLDLSRMLILVDYVDVR